MDAFLIDDGKLVRGSYENHRFIPFKKDCGFHYQTILESELGKILFFDEKIALLMLEEEHENHKRYLVKLKTDKFHDDLTQIVSASCPRVALKRLARLLHLKNDVCILNLYNILEEAYETSIENYMKEENIVQTEDGTYVSVIELTEFNNASI